MDNTSIPIDDGNSFSDAEVLEFIDNEIIQKLDRLNRTGDSFKKYSEIYTGGVYALRSVHRIKNPDWMSQSANSFREIFYILKNDNKGTDQIEQILNNHLKKSLTPDEVNKYRNYLTCLYCFFTDIAHHFSLYSPEEFEILEYKVNDNLTLKAKTLSEKDYLDAVKLLKEYLKIMIVSAIDIHTKIDDCLKNNKQDKELVIVLINSSEDAKRYFFSRTDKTWLTWLRTNGFFSVLKNKSDDPTKIIHSLPELDYLVRMAPEDPDIVAKIISSTKISQETFNPEVIDRFLWIVQSLPSEQIKSLTKKIRDEEWFKLMIGFRKSGYELTQIVKKLSDANESEALLELAQSIFLVKSKEEVAEQEKRDMNLDNPFYLSDLDACGVFEALTNIDDSYKEKALELTTSVMSEFVKLGNKDESGVFEYTDMYALYDVDFYTLEISNKNSYSYREDIKNLAATIKKLTENLIVTNIDNEKAVKRIVKNFDKIPTCRSSWRLRLFVLSQAPLIFKNDLKEAFTKLFTVDNYYDIEGGAEYQKALKIGFPYLSEKDKRIYVKNVFEYFSKKIKEHLDQDWHKRTGWEILSVICDNLTEEEKEQCVEVFGSPCDGSYIPTTGVSEITGGIVSHKSPEDVSKYPVVVIAENLKTIWTAEKLKEEFKDDDFLNPRGVEGLGEAIKNDVKNRLDEYLTNISSFLDRKHIHASYVYYILRAIEEMLRERKELTESQTVQLIEFFCLIRDSGLKEEFHRKEERSWLPDWIEVHKVMTDALLFILENKNNKAKTHLNHREQIKNLIIYLLSIISSPSVDDDKPDYGPPHNVAINTVRGRAYECFVVFTENDGKVLAEDTKTIFLDVLKDTSLAVRFMVGRYLATFYFHDKKFIVSHLTNIFPITDTEKKDLYLATWEGYLSQNLYGEFFNDLENYYSYAINLDPSTYTERKYSKELDESLGLHLSLAFVHLGLEIASPLFKQFWSVKNTDRHKEFISYLGRHCLTKDTSSGEWLVENRVDKRLIVFWDWVLENINEPEVLSGFGFWINPDKEVLDDNLVIERIIKTLKKSNGALDWDYGLMRRLPSFAIKNPIGTLEIISSFLLDVSGNLNQNRQAPLFSIDNEIKESLEVVYKNGDSAIKQNVEELIENLIEKGSTMFWNLKDILR